MAVLAGNVKSILDRRHFPFLAGLMALNTLFASSFIPPPGVMASQAENFERFTVLLMIESHSPIRNIKDNLVPGGENACNHET